MIGPIGFRTKESQEKQYVKFYRVLVELVPKGVQEEDLLVGLEPASPDKNNARDNISQNVVLVSA